MHLCGKCGAVMLDNDKFCTKCGTEVGTCDFAIPKDGVVTNTPPAAPTDAALQSPAAAAPACASGQQNTQNSAPVQENQNPPAHISAYWAEKGPLNMDDFFKGMEYPKVRSGIYAFLVFAFIIVAISTIINIVVFNSQPFYMIGALVEAFIYLLCALSVLLFKSRIGASAFAGLYVADRIAVLVSGGIPGTSFASSTSSGTWWWLILALTCLVSGITGTFQFQTYWKAYRASIAPQEVPPTKIQAFFGRFSSKKDSPVTQPYPQQMPYPNATMPADPIAQTMPGQPYAQPMTAQQGTAVQGYQQQPAPGQPVYAPQSQPVIPSQPAPTYGQAYVPQMAPAQPVANPSPQNDTPSPQNGQGQQ